MNGEREERGDAEKGWARGKKKKKEKTSLFLMSIREGEKRDGRGSEKLPG